MFAPNTEFRTPSSYSGPMRTDQKPSTNSSTPVAVVAAAEHSQMSGARRRGVGDLPIGRKPGGAGDARSNRTTTNTEKRLVSRGLVFTRRLRHNQSRIRWRVGQMANRDVRVRLLADPSNFKQGFLEAGKSMRVAEREAYKMKKAQQEMHSAMSEIGPVVLGMGAAIAAGLFMATKSAIEWESAWAGVTKTVDGSEAQMAELEKGLLGLAKVLPATHTEIAAVAEAAGQLGIARDDVIEFTEVMIALGVSTNLSSEEAATSLARLMNIMEIAPSNVQKLGNVIVELGNNSATTEAEIVEMSMRIAGAGHQLGMTADEVMALAAAMSSVGLRAEMGGSAISSVMIRMSKHVSENSSELEKWASLAGMSASEFAKAFREDAAQALSLVIDGLGRMKSQGGDVIATLGELGITEIRQRDTLMRLAGAQGLYTDMLGMANEEYASGNALMEEAEKRYQTTESQIQIAQNRINNFAIAIGEHLLPVIGSLAAGLGGLADWFSDLPGPVQGAITVVGVLGATVGLLGGTALIAIPKIAAFNAALATMGMGGKVRAGLSGIAGVLTGPLGAALGFGALALGAYAAEQSAAAARAKELSDTLDAQSGAITANSRIWLANKLIEDGAADIAEKHGMSISEVIDALLAQGDAYENVTEKLKEKGEYEKLGVNDAKLLKDSLDESSDAISRAKHLWGMLAEEQEKASDSSGKTTAAQKALAQTLGITEASAVDAGDAISNMDKELNELIDTLFGLKDAQAQVTLGLESLKTAVDSNGTSLDVMTVEGAKNHGVVTSLMDSYFELGKELISTAGSMDEAEAIAQDLKDQFIEQMRAAGFAEEQIQEYADSFDNIPSIATTLLEITQRIKPVDYSSAYKSGDFGGQYAFADGGLIRGPGGPRSDSIPIWASNGEYVINAEATRRNLPLLDWINEGGNANQYATRVLATGGGSGGGGNTYNVTVTALPGREANLKDIENQLKYRGIG